MRLTLQVLRDGKPFELKLLTPRLIRRKKKRRASEFRGISDGRMSLSHPNPVEQVYDSITSTLNTIGAVASPKSDVKLQHLSGPIGIGRIYYLLFQSERGWQFALWFSVILNVNLAILNMLPIPVLDGGHIVLAIIESIRRKPVNIRVLEVIQTGCAVLIIGYMLYVSFFDIGDWFGRDSDETKPSRGRLPPHPRPKRKRVPASPKSLDYRSYGRHPDYYGLRT